MKFAFHDRLKAGRVRVTVDPNSASRLDPNLTVSSFDDANLLPTVGEQVIAVQPEDSGPAFVGSARVVQVDRARGLIYLAVDWKSFRDEQLTSPWEAPTWSPGVWSDPLRASRSLVPCNQTSSRRELMLK